MLRPRVPRSARFAVGLARAPAAAAALLIGTACLAGAPRADDTAITQARGVPHEVVLLRYFPLFGNSEVLRRLLSPLAAAQLRDTLARTRKVLSPYALDLTKERFLLYVPSRPPPSPRGFGLLVFVAPWKPATLPQGWALQLNRYGFIFVTPEDADNAAAVLSRRVPLALSAEQNIARELPVDPQRIFIGGFSGGSRVALRIALGYPDVFHGALLNAGADPLGGPTDPLPPRDLFFRFQSSSHLVYVTGTLDSFNLDTDASSSASMRHWCLADVETRQTPDVGHEVMSSAAFGQALARLVRPPPPAPDPAVLAACRAHLEAELQGKLAQVQALIAASKQAAARKLLLAIDARYGGLAGPYSLELAQSCRCGLASP